MTLASLTNLPVEQATRLAEAVRFVLDHFQHANVQLSIGSGVAGRQSVEVRIRLDDLINRGDLDENIRVLPGDVLIIPESIL